MQLNTQKSRINHRKPAVQAATGLSNTTLYARIKEGLFPPPVKLGPMISVWPSDELDQIQAAWIAGKSESEIRSLVAELIAARKLAA